MFGIGELAGRFGLATHVLRHWEAAGLLIPAARVGGRRQYTSRTSPAWC
jgi:DNA-binding transcriptional MerR regulator